jgi:hypothetical protein
VGRVDIRFAKREDARSILGAHYSAVHETAARDYTLEMDSSLTAAPFYLHHGYEEQVHLKLAAPVAIRRCARCCFDTTAQKWFYRNALKWILF